MKRSPETAPPFVDERKAWLAIVDNIAERGYGSEEVLVAIAMRAGDIHRSTARNLIREGVTHGYLTVERVRSAGGRWYRRVRLAYPGGAAGRVGNATAARQRRA